MENASKALIIAGAILISIVLVSVGVIVVNSLNPDSAVEEMTKQEVQTFNSKFDGSIGDNKLGTVARSLVSTVMTNNANVADDTYKVEVELSDGSNSQASTSDETVLSTMRNKINNSVRYKIEIVQNDANGRVKKIKITRN